MTDDLPSEDDFHDAEPPDWISGPSGGDLAEWYARDDADKLVRATFIQNWPEALRDLSIPSAGFALEPAERRALLVALWGADGDEVPDDVMGDLRPGDVRELLAHVADRIERARSCLGETSAGAAAFVRLGSRSPKDSFHGIIEGFAVTSGRAALRLLLDSPERVGDDLASDEALGHPSWIFVRQWVDMPDWSEFRCVLRDGRFAGASQYDFNSRTAHERIADREGEILAILQSFGDRVSEAVAGSPELHDLVFDAAFAGGDLARPILIEVNPLCPLTDSCLFESWPRPGDPPVLLHRGDGRRAETRDDPDVSQLLSP